MMPAARSVFLAVGEIVGGFISLHPSILIVMPPASLATVLRHLRRSAGNAPGVDDAALLDRFATDRDEAAFELLVWRHGPMVLGVCRRRLGDIHAAEDAFQATFLALARRAKSIRRQSSVGGWLYRVAGRVALAARERSMRKVEQPLEAMTPPGREPEPADVVALRELRRALDDAVGRLPARYRDPLVLTCFAGRSHAEAARQLGCAVRTVESRLGRARQKLRATLLRRGLLPVGGLAAALAPAEAPAGMAPSLVLAAVRAAGTGTASFAIDTLTQGVLHAMLLSKIKIFGAVMFVAGFVGLGTGGMLYQSRAVGQPPSSDPTNTLKHGTAYKQDRKERVRELLRELDEAMKDDSSPETAQQIQKLLNAAAERQREQHEQEIQATLATIAANIARLEHMSAGDKARERAVSEFKDNFHRLGDFYKRRTASKELGVSVNNAIIPYSLDFAFPIHVGDQEPAANSKGQFMAGLGLRGFEFGGAREGQKTEAIGRITNINGKMVQIETSGNVSIGQALSVVRLGDDPHYIGRIKITANNGKSMIAETTQLAWRQAIRVGDMIMVEITATEEGSKERGN
jgi:RNA polymerase sigma factor (sigma-70 family)